MRFAAIVLFALCSTSALAGARVVVPSLPEAVRPDAEVSTNIALNVNAARLQTLTLSVEFESCVTNEVLVAIGADADLDGDLSMDEADIVFVAGAMLLPSFEGEDLAAFMKKAREDGKMTVMDTAWDKDGKWLCRIKEALPFTDLFMPSFEEAKALSGESDPEKIADFFFDCGCGSVIIKLGKQGALLCEKRDQRIYVPIVEGVTVKDTTGAGDAFCAGFLYGISKGWSYERSGAFACAVSACCIEQTGASAGVCSAEKILERFGGSI
jgi:sugar/nucleoside kinase (ribokinase family)